MRIMREEMETMAEQMATMGEQMATMGEQMATMGEQIVVIGEQMATLQQQLNVGQSLGSSPAVTSYPSSPLSHVIRNGLAAPSFAVPPRANPGGYAPVVHDVDAVLLSLPGLLARQHRELMGALRVLTEEVVGQGVDIGQT
ncbi:hypothetical protein MMC07_003384 [Pseudocyphellaria aurata]|nr:hypothetical protein [Pseudocyphellaria aurata]